MGNAWVTSAANQRVSILWDNVAPVVTAISALTASPTNAGTLQFSFTFSEMVLSVAASSFDTTGTTAGSVGLTLTSGYGTGPWIVSVRRLGSSRSQLGFRFACRLMGCLSSAFESVVRLLKRSHEIVVRVCSQVTGMTTSGVVSLRVKTTTSGIADRAGNSFSSTAANTAVTITMDLTGAVLSSAWLAACAG